MFGRAESHDLPVVCPLPTTGSICTAGPEIEHGLQEQVLTEAKNNPGVCKVHYYGDPAIPLYSFTYCRGDNSKFQCSKCLEEAVGVIAKKCNNKHGAQYTKPAGRCCIRYENYQFCPLS
ncbi:unnamed protein product [Linum trigynum]